MKYCYEADISGESGYRSRVSIPVLLADKNNFCVVEHLSPLKFNLSGNCFTGPVRQTSLALITCPNSKQVVSIEALDKCFSSEVGFLCPKHVLKTISSSHWLGFAWNPELKLSFARNHQAAPNCDHLQPLIHQWRKEISFYNFWFNTYY